MILFKKLRAAVERKLKNHQNLGVIFNFLLNLSKVPLGLTSPKFSKPSRTDSKQKKNPIFFINVPKRLILITKSFIFLKLVHLFLFIPRFYSWARRGNNFFPFLSSLSKFLPLNGGCN